MATDLQKTLLDIQIYYLKHKPMAERSGSSTQRKE